MSPYSITSSILMFIYIHAKVSMTSRHNVFNINKIKHCLWLSVHLWRNYLDTVLVFNLLGSNRNKILNYDKSLALLTRLSASRFILQTTWSQPPAVDIWRYN